MNYPRLAAYSGQRSGGSPLVNNDGTLNQEMCTALARYGTVTVDMNAMLINPQIWVGLKAANPNVRIAGYALVTHWWLPPEFVPNPSDKTMNASIHKMLVATNGLMTPFVEGYRVDWSQQDVADGYTDIFCSAVATRLFDDIFFDYLAPVASWAGVGNAMSDAVRTTNMKILVSRTRAVGGAAMRVFGNGTGSEKLSCDGTMIEGYPNQTTASFSRAVNQLPGDWLKSEGSGTGMPQVARLGLGTACLTGAFWTYGTDHYVREPYDGTWWFPEYSVAADGRPDPTGANVGWLGQPKGDAVNCGNGLWSRFFENGCVLVNPGPVAVFKDFFAPCYRRIGAGAPLERSFTVSSQDALFLRV